MADKIDSPTPSLRCRSRSCSRASSDDSFNTAVGQVSHGQVSTPGYGLSFHPRGQRGNEDRCRKISRDSGFGAGSPMGDASDWSNNSSISKLKRTASQLIEGSPTLNDLQKQWRKKKVSLYSSSPVKKSIGNYRTAEMLPLYVVLLTFGAGLFTLIVLNNALNKHGRPSTAFIKAPEKVKIDELVDEYGNPLGGKKAAIQFYHNLNNPQVLEAKPDDPDPELVRVMKEAQPEVQEVKGDDPDPDELVRITNKEEPSEELVKKLTLQLTHNIAEMQKEMLEQEAAKKKLLDKLSQSGHFGTTFHKPEVEKPEKKEIENVVPEVKLLVKREANQPLPAMSPKENPFRISDTTLVKADEEFRFLPEQ